MWLRPDAGDGRQHADHRDGGELAHHQPRRQRQGRAGKVSVGGIARDAGYGIRVVEGSTDGGKSWSQATLGDDLGRFAFRPWSFALSAKRGDNTVMVRATNAIGQYPVGVSIRDPPG